MKSRRFKVSMNRMLAYLLLIVYAAFGMILNPQKVVSKSNQDRPHLESPAPKPSRESEVTVDHPLRLGRLRGEAYDLRLKEFLNSLKALKESKRKDKKTGPLFREYIDDIGVRGIVQSIQDNDPSCHGILHQLGSLIEEQVHDLRTSVALCQDACTYACIHGAFKERFTRAAIGREPPSTSIDEPAVEQPVPDLKALATEVDLLCREDSKLIADFFRGNCAHAVGHAFGVLEKDHSRLKTYCSFFNESEMRYYCYTGVYMEVRSKIRKDLFNGMSTRMEKLKSAMDFCLNHTEWPSACMRFIPNPAKSPLEISFIAKHCMSQKGMFRRMCFNSLGFMSRHYLILRPEAINLVCRYGNDSDHRMCISGVSFIKKNHRWKEDMKAVCEMVNHEELKSLCNDQRLRHYYQLDNPATDILFKERSSLNKDQMLIFEAARYG